MQGGDITEWISSKTIKSKLTEDPLKSILQAGHHLELPSQLVIIWINFFEQILIWISHPESSRLTKTHIQLKTCVGEILMQSLET